MEKRTILSITICALIILIYPYVLRIFYPDYGKPPAPHSAPADPVAGPRLSSEDRAPVPVRSEPRASLTTPSVPEDETRRVNTGVYDLVVSKNFGSLLVLGFQGFRDPVTGEPVGFLRAANGATGVGATQILIDGTPAPAAAFETKIDSTHISSRARTGEFELVKDFRFGGAYGNEFHIEYTNRTDRPQKVVVRIYAGSGLIRRSTIDPQYFEANWIGEDEIKHVRGPSKDKVKTSERPWPAVSIKNRHFSSLFKSQEGRWHYAGVRGLENHDFTAYIETPVMDLRPGASWSESFLYYAGLNGVEDLKPYGLDHVVNFGKLDAVCKFLVGTMQLVHKVARNYGLAIIILTLAMNVVLLPLTRAAFLSMRRMQIVQPQMTKLREKYKGDPTRLNKEMIELYKKHKVNPMGGCLPMLMQMPIFVALYVALSKSTELLGARFLWVKDLASPDSVPLPFSLPLVGNTLHVLPLIMVAGMVIQQKLSQVQMAGADPQMAQQQKIMMTIMPVFFGFIFYPMPSGLVLYWLTNTVATSTVQLWLKKSHPVPAS